MTRKMDLAQALGMAFAQWEAGRLPQARKLARDLEKLRPDLPGLAYLQGLLALAEGQGRKAAQHLTKALAQSPDAPPLLLAMARAQTQQNRTDDAVTHYRHLLDIAPATTDAQAELAELLLAREDWTAAAPLLSAALAVRPDWAKGHNNLGVALRELGQWNEAALSFARAADLDPTLIKASVNLAAVLRRLKRPADALAAATGVITAATDNLLPPTGDLADAWIEAGLALRDQNDLPAALSAFQSAQTALPSGAPKALSTRVYWLQGEALRSLDRHDEAVAAYRRVLADDPADLYGAKLILAQMGAADAPAQAPEAYVRKLFDQYADGFDHDLVEVLGYRAPALLADAITKTIAPGPFDVLDLGCGTGLMGAALAERGLTRPGKRLVGVDLSPRMVEKTLARRHDDQSPLYSGAEAGDLLAVLKRENAAWDVIAAADVFVYLGDLDTVFAAAAQALRAGGALAFTTEQAADGFILHPTSRYGHSAAYLRGLAQTHGLEVAILEDCWTRREQGEPVPGFLAVLRKPS